MNNKILCCINDYSIYKNLIHNQQFRRTENLSVPSHLVCVCVFIYITVSLICLKCLFAYRAYFSIRARKESLQNRNGNYNKKKNTTKQYVFQPSCNSLENVLAITQLIFLKCCNKKWTIWFMMLPIYGSSLRHPE